MTDRRTDHLTRKRVSEMSPDEMRTALLVSAKTGLPNRRAFDEGESAKFVAMIDVNGLKALNDTFGYSAGDVLICRLADVLLEVGLDVYHDKGDEFLAKGKSYQDLNGKLSEALLLLKNQPFAVSGLDGRITTIEGADFSFGIGTKLEEAEKSLKHQKELRKVANQTIRGAGDKPTAVEKTASARVNSWNEPFAARSIPIFILCCELLIANLSLFDPVLDRRQNENNPTPTPQKFLPPVPRSS